MFVYLWSVAAAHPIVIPVPLALAAIALMAAGWVAARPEPFPAWPLPARQQAPTGRHRLDAAAAPYRPRPWTALDRVPVIPGPPPATAAVDPLDPAVPLADVERSLAPAR